MKLWKAPKTIQCNVASPSSEHIWWYSCDANIWPFPWPFQSTSPELHFEWQSNPTHYLLLIEIMYFFLAPRSWIRDFVFLTYDSFLNPLPLKVIFCKTRPSHLGLACRWITLPKRGWQMKQSILAAFLSSNFNLTYTKPRRLHLAGLHRMQQAGLPQFFFLGCLLREKFITPLNTLCWAQKTYISSSPASSASFSIVISMLTCDCSMLFSRSACTTFPDLWDYNKLELISCTYLLDCIEAGCITRIPAYLPTAPQSCFTSLYYWYNI